MKTVRIKISKRGLVENAEQAMFETTVASLEKGEWVMKLLKTKKVFTFR
jgi:hypothetical protein